MDTFLKIELKLLLKMTNLKLREVKNKIQIFVVIVFFTYFTSIGGFSRAKNFVINKNLKPIASSSIYSFASDVTSNGLIG